jgi:hypothetical protein
VERLITINEFEDTIHESVAAIVVQIAQGDFSSKVIRSVGITARTT